MALIVSLLLWLMCLGWLVSPWLSIAAFAVLLVWVMVEVDRAEHEKPAGTGL